MSRPLMSAMTLALLGALPGWSSAASTPRYSASASLVPNPASASGRFSLQAQLHPAGAALPSDAKQADHERPAAAANGEDAPRFRLLAAMRDKSAPEGAVCGADNLFQNGYE